MTINLVSNRNYLLNVNFKQANLNFKAKDGESKNPSTNMMSRGLANAMRSVALATLLIGGGCSSKQEVTVDSVKTELSSSQVGSEIQKQIELLFLDADKSFNIKGMNSEQKEAFLKQYNKAVDTAAVMLYRGEEDEIKENVKVAKKYAKNFAEFMTDDKLSIKDKAKEFAKLIESDSTSTRATSIYSISTIANCISFLTLALIGIGINMGIGHIECKLAKLVELYEDKNSNKTNEVNEH